MITLSSNSKVIAQSQQFGDKFKIAIIKIHTTTTMLP